MVLIYGKNKKESIKTNGTIFNQWQPKHELPMMPYCGCAGDCLAAGVWRVLLTVALCGLVHVELMFSDGGLDGAVVLGRGRVRVRMRVRMRMRMGGRELGGDAVLGRGRKLGWWVGLGHGWIRGRRCVLVTLRRRKRFSVTCFAWRLNVDGTWIWKTVMLQGQSKTCLGENE